MTNNTTKRRRTDEDGYDIPKKRQRTTQELAKIEQAESRSPAASYASLAGMPYDIIEAIFEESSIDASVCLGLTCTKLFAFYKLHHGEAQIELHMGVNFADDTPSEVRTQRRHLGDLLANWGTAGSPYRYSPLMFRFLNVAVYGLFEGTEERRLFGRYGDWYFSMASLDHRLVFPSPFNRGEEWYGEALAVVKASLDLFGDVVTWAEHWRQTRVFRDNWQPLNRFAHEWNQKRSTVLFRDEDML